MIKTRKKVFIALLTVLFAAVLLSAGATVLAPKTSPLAEETSCEFPSNWKTTLGSSVYSKLTEIVFAKTAPAGYVDSGKTLNTNIKVYEKDDDATKIAFVYDGVITAPTNSSSLFNMLSYLTSVKFDNFSTSNVTSLAGMFTACTRLASVDVTGFDVSKVTDMTQMFFYCPALTSLDLSSFDTSNTDGNVCMLGMFSSCSGLTDTGLVLSDKFVSSKVTDISGLFGNCTGLTSLDLSKFDVSNVTTLQQLFSGCSGLTSVVFGDSFSTAKVRNMRSMFDGCTNLTSITFPDSFDTSSVTDMSGMFKNVGVTSLDLSGFDASNVTSATDMFANCSALDMIKTPVGIGTRAMPLPATFWNGSDFITQITATDAGKNVIRHAEHIGGAATCSAKAVCEVCGYGYGELEPHNPATAWSADDKTHYHECLNGCGAKSDEAAHTFANGKCTVCDAEQPFYWGIDSGVLTLSDNDNDGKFSLYNTKSTNIPWYSRNDVTSIKVEGTVYAPSSMSSWFDGLQNLTAVDLTGLDTSNVTDMSDLFSSCNYLTSLDLSGLDTSSVTNMSSMFRSCDNLTSITFGDCFDTSNVTNMSYMFNGCRELTSLDLSCFDTSNVTAMTSMFGSCIKFATLNLSSFDMSKVTAATYMFDGCGVLNEIQAPATLGNRTLSLPAKFWNGETDITEITSADAGKTIKRHASHSGGTATCTHKAVCEVCNTEYGELNKENHIPSQPVIENRIEATCSAEGSYYEVIYCTECHTEISKTQNTLNIDPTAHSWNDGEVTTLPACTTAGIKTFTCTYNPEHTKQESVDALGHDIMQHEAQAATCTEIGWNAYETCSRCDHTTYAEIAALGHDIIQHEAQAATCTEIGWNAYETCSRCDHTTYVEIAALGHTYGEWIDEVAATVAQDGVKAHKDCTVCNKHFDANDDEITDLTIPALGEVPRPESVTVIVSGGTFDGSNESHITVDKNGTVTVIAATKDGKTFKGWSIDGGATIISESARYSFAAAESVTITAIYEDIAPVASSDSGLSDGAIAGIAVGSTLFALIVTYIVCYFALYRRSVLFKGKAFDVIYKPMNAIFNKKDKSE